MRVIYSRVGQAGTDVLKNPRSEVAISALIGAPDANMSTAVSEVWMCPRAAQKSDRRPLAGAPPSGASLDSP